MKKLVFIPFVGVMLLLGMSCGKEDSSTRDVSNSNTTGKYILAVEGKSFEANVKGISRKTYYLYNPSGTTNSYKLTVNHPIPSSVSIAPVGKIVAGPVTSGANKKWTVQLSSCSTWRGSSPAIVDVYYDSSSQPQVYYSFIDGCYY